MRNSKLIINKLVSLGLLKHILIIGSIFLTLYIGLCLFLRFWQTRLIFFPPATIAITPAEVNLRYEEVWLPVSTGKLHAWWIESSKPDAPVLLYFHGNGSNIGDLVNRASRFHDLGVSVLLFDYRGYGKSSAPFPNEALVYEDAATALDYLTRSRNIDAQNIILYGHSLGGAIAIELASKHPNLAGVIVEGTFTSIGAVAEEVSLYRLFPIDWIVTEKFDSLSKVRSLKMPALFIHGTADEVVPAKMSQQLYDATPEPKKLLLIPNAGHNDAASLGGEQYLEALIEFLEKTRDLPRKNR
ncbi:alpha/beta hydrolase [Candidatus Gracilibacteria bacterium]|nr:alpha/beta hydrolase [Candidatus Gracilibacteria bacterium]NJM86868.1 alpha/beta hydrolase [Hydrococcus sp. RU_2_2]NJP19932.1 alpha/beta hydrolase [Hydrococcus sp. CRU_1_1]